LPADKSGLTRNDVCVPHAASVYAIMMTAAGQARPFGRSVQMSAIEGNPDADFAGRDARDQPIAEIQPRSETIHLPTTDYA
jgi:hypothetical protein